MAKRIQSTAVETKEFLRELASETATNKRFQHIRTDQSFVIENLEAAEDPVKISEDLVKIVSAFRNASIEPWKNHEKQEWNPIR